MTSREKLIEQVQASLRANEFGNHFQDCWKGEHAVVLASGPSVRDYIPGEDGETRLVVCNSVAPLFPNADVWLTSETNANLFPWWNAGQAVFTGVQVHDHGMLYDTPHDAPVPEKALWHCRDVWYGDPHLDPRQSYAGALWQGCYIPLDGSGDQFPGGTVTMQALHLCAIAGCTEIDLYGAELCWAYGKGQHHDGWSPYTDEYAAKHGEVRLLRFDVPDGVFTESPDGKFETTVAFWQAAVVLRGFIGHLAKYGVKVNNYSSGLMCMARL